MCLSLLLQVVTPEAMLILQFQVLQKRLGSSPSGFTTRETKLHVVCESKLDKLAKPAGMSRDVFGGACQIHIAVLGQKNF